MTAPSEERTQDLYCPTCNVQVAAREIANHSALEPDQWVVDFDSDPVKVIQYAFLICTRCNSPFLTRQRFLEVPAEFSAPQDDPEVLYPIPRNFDSEGLPASVGRSYFSAVASFRAGLYEPCAIMCRKCLEAIARESGGTGRSLFNRLQDLKERGVIDGKLLNWADGLRVIGNDAAHDLDIVISEGEAQDALQFVEALIMYVFQLCRRFNEFQRRRAANKAANQGVATDGRAAAERP